ncbi:MAG: class I SAM-dependent methyltransferase [Cyanobacteria bacterium J06638_20]
MKPEHVQSLYGPGYAAGYNTAFIDDPLFKGKTDAEVLILSTLLNTGSSLTGSARWLDLACGTGYFLSKFPETERTGVDLSDAMLCKARGINPCIPLIQGDLRNRKLFGRGSWDVISSMWWAYSYLDTIRQIKKFIRNVSFWLTQEGYFFLPIASLGNFGCGVKGYPKQDYPYPLFSSLPVLGGELSITAIHWSWKEASGSVHEHLLAPHPELMRSIALEYFKTVDIIRYHEYGYIGLICSNSASKLSAMRELFPDVAPYRPITPEV